MRKELFISGDGVDVYVKDVMYYMEYSCKSDTLLSRRIVELKRDLKYMLCLSELDIIFQSCPDSCINNVKLIVRPDEINKVIYKDEFISVAVLRGLNLEDSCTNISIYSSSFEKISDMGNKDKLLSNPILTFVDGRYALYESIIAPYNAYVKPKFTEIIRELGEVSSDITIMNTKMSFNVEKNRIELTIKTIYNPIINKQNVLEIFKVIIKYCKPYSSFNIVIREV